MIQDFTGRMEELEREISRIGGRSITNEVEIVNNGQRMVYEGSAFELNFDDKDNLHGYCTLKKYAMIEENFLWHKYKDRSLEIWAYFERTMPQPCLVQEGKICHAYRNSLKLFALNRSGYIITDKLLSMVFDPIDKQLMDIYNKIMGERK